MIHLERADAKDAETIVRLKIDAFKREVQLYGYGPPNYSSVEQQRKVLEDKSIDYYKVYDGGTLIGGASVTACGEGQYYLSSIYIADGTQNTGAGSRTLQLLLERYPDAVKWTLETPCRSLRNHHFYEKHGFVKVGETAPEPDGFFLFLYEKLPPQAAQRSV